MPPPYYPLRLSRQEAKKQKKKEKKKQRLISGYTRDVHHFSAAVYVWIIINFQS